MKQPDIQLRLYRAILIAGAGVSLFSMVGNYIAAFPWWISLKWVLLLFVSLLALLHSQNKRYRDRIMFSVFLFLICFFLPFAFIDSGGSDNHAIGYTFLLLITITYLFKKWKRILLVAVLILVFMLLHVLEYTYPEIIRVYPDQNQFIDRMIQIPLLLGAAFFIILRFAKEYERVNERLGLTAHFDELTGLYNRRRFNQAMEEAMEGQTQTIHLAFLDIDHFKRVNDQFGHHVGDKVLKELAGLLKTAFGLDRHVVSRWGGDEFAIIYYGDQRELTKKLEEIRKSFKVFVSLYVRTAGISISVVPLSSYEQLAQTLEDADRQLYQEKQKKRSE